MRKLVLLALPATVIVGLLAGCSGTTTGAAGSISSGAPTAAAATASPTEEAAANPKFGETYTFPSGLKLSVSAPEPFTPSEYAAGAGASNVKFNVTIVNGTKDTFSPVVIQFTPTAGGQAGTSIEDSAQGVSSFPSASSVAVGATTSWTMGYGFPDATGVTIQADPNDFTSKAVTFTS